MIVAVDLFCGAGGLTRGLAQAGIPVVAGIDINESARRSYEHNNPDSRFICGDVRDVTGSFLRKQLPAKPKQLALVGCAPCQPFSSHRRTPRVGRESALLNEFGRLVEELNPRWVFMENVPGIANVPGFSAFRRFLKTLDDLNYNIVTDVVDAKWYGVPQTRRHLVVLAGKCEEVSLPPKRFGKGLAPYRTVREAISHLSPLKAGEQHRKDRNHVASRLTAINLSRLATTPKNGGSRAAWKASLLLECHKVATGHQDAYGRMSWDHPAPTLTCRCFSISNGRYGHPEQDRAISLREAANLQSFPEGYEFFGPSIKSIGEQIGNAVPVQLAEAVGSHILKMSRTARGK